MWAIDDVRWGCEGKFIEENSFYFFGRKLAGQKIKKVLANL